MSPHSVDARPATALDREADRAVAQVRAWLGASRVQRPRLAAALMERALATPGGLRYLTEVVDGVMRPEDLRVAARALRRAAADAGHHLPRSLAALARASAVASRIAPRVTARLARHFVHALVSHLVVDARPRRLTRSLSRLRRGGSAVNVNLLGEAVLGASEAAKRVEATRGLVRQPAVDYVSIKVSAAVAPHSPWAFDEAVEAIVDSLMPVYDDALVHGGTFVNLDMEEYRDLDLTLSVFERIVTQERLLPLSAGIVVQAYLPESTAALTRLQHIAASRVAAGGAPLRVRIVKGANLSMERVEAELRGWPAAPWRAKVDTDAQYKRLIDQALRPAHTEALRVGIAGHNLFDVAHAWHVAQERGVMDHVQFEMLLGMGENVATAVAEDVGALRLYTPVVDPRDFDVALAYLVRRLEEVANPQNFLSRLSTLSTSPEHFAMEEHAFRAALDASRRPAPTDSFRQRAALHEDDGTFRNAPDLDPALPGVRERGRGALMRAGERTLAEPTLRAARVDDAAELATRIARAHTAGVAWGRTPPAARATVLDRVAEALEQRRDQLLEVMAQDAGKTLDQADPEVSEAVDFARYYAMCARDLAAHEGAEPRPRALTLVTPPWNFPVAIPAGSTLAALAAGSAVVLKAAPESARCGAVLAEAMWEAGVPRDVLELLTIDDDALGATLVGDARIDQVILTGAYQTARLFLGMRPDLRLHAETSGKNAMIITPSADLDLAVKDLVASAFGHAGQKCSAASLAILVGSVAESERFRSQVLDAVRSLVVAPASAVTAQMGPMISPPRGKLLRGLTELDDREQWWIQPRRIDDALWTPGVRGWVDPGSTTHTVEYFGPVLGVMRARTLDEAVSLVNEIDYGLTSGLHSLDEHEIRTWIDGVEAGNLYVNRGTTGAIVQRQPFGGWKRSVVGPTVKAGGPHYVATLTDWSRHEPLVPTGEPLEPAVEQLCDAVDAPWVRRSAELDAHAWATRFGHGHDPTALAAERNILRYCPAPTSIRWDGAATDDLARVVIAAVTAHTAPAVSVAAPPSPRLTAAIEAAGLHVVQETDAELASRLEQVPGARVRIVGTRDPVWLGRADIAHFSAAVTGASSLEMLPFLREQAISITAHRYGTEHAPAVRVGDELLASGVAVVS